MPTTETPPILIPDYRQTGHALPCLSMRMPSAIVAGLDAQASRIGTNRSALARALVAQGLERLQAV